MKRKQASECSGCGSKEPWLLHNVRHRGIYRRICTSCVLKFHPGMFCSICFEVYDCPLPPNARAICLKCPSVSHLPCVGLDVAPGYVCVTCLNPSFSFFDVCGSNKRSKGSDGEPVLDEGQRIIDEKSAKVLVAAARLASISMNKAAIAAWVEAERRAKETNLAKKRAKEALERVPSMVLKEKKKEMEPSLELLGVSGLDTVVEQKKRVTSKFKIQNSIAVDVKENSRNPNSFPNHIGQGEEKNGSFRVPPVAEQCPEDNHVIDNGKKS